MKVKFFAWLKDDLQEEISIDIDNLSISELKVRLISVLGDKAKILNEPSILVSVNLEFATDQTIVKNDDEVAFFPPVTGG